MTMDSYSVSWETDHEIDTTNDETSPHRIAAAEIWTHIFGRSLTADGLAEPDTACVFTVNGPDADGEVTTLTIDLSQPPGSDILQ